MTGPADPLPPTEQQLKIAALLAKPRDLWLRDILKRMTAGTLPNAEEAAHLIQRAQAADGIKAAVGYVVAVYVEARDGRASLDDAEFRRRFDDALDIASKALIGLEVIARQESPERRTIVVPGLVP